jgi:K+-sensing histidine kinase KdpD
VAFNAFASLVALVFVILLIGRDAYARRRERELAAEIAALRQQVKATDRLASVGRLVSGLAQDLKSPLQGMLGNAEVLAASDARSVSSVEEVQDIRDNVSRAVGIVRNLLAYTETNALQRRWHDVNDIVRDAIVRPRRDVADVRRVRFEDSARLPLVYIDGRQVEKVVATILEHARRYGGREREGDVRIATSRGTSGDDRLVIDIEDPALPLADDAPEWAGDLDGCRRILEMHGGSFEVERHRAGGIRFHLELPVTEQVETQAT